MNSQLTRGIALKIHDVEIDPGSYTVNTAHGIVAHIAEWIKLAETVLGKDVLFESDIRQAQERLIRAETLEAQLTPNGPGQRLFEQIELSKRKVNALRLTPRFRDYETKKTDAQKQRGPALNKPMPPRPTTPTE